MTWACYTHAVAQVVSSTGTVEVQPVLFDNEDDDRRSRNELGAALLKGRRCVVVPIELAA